MDPGLIFGIVVASIVSCIIVTLTCLGTFGIIRADSSGRPEPRIGTLKYDIVVVREELT